MIAVPSRLAARPRTASGLPIPWFVDAERNPVDFRLIRTDAVVQAWNHQLCWICGTRLGRFQCYVVGPVSVITRVHSEPPCHRECAIFAATACPFLSNPDMRRTPETLPEGAEAPPEGHMPGNPGVVAIWVAEASTISRGAEPAMDGDDKVLFSFTGELAEVLWFTRGRPATRPEVYAALEVRLPAMLSAAQAEGPKAVQQLKAATFKANKMLPQLRAEDVVEAG
jgi:hypothetical protein